jgi:cytochrome c peroxidase
LTSILSKLTVFSLVFVFLGLIWQFIPSSNHSSDKRLYPVIGNAKKLKDSYEIWKAKATKNGAEKKILIQLGYMKGLSSNFTEAHGQASIDLTDGTLNVEVIGLNAEKDFDFWFVDNISGPGKSVKPEAGDKIVNLGKLENNNGHLVLNKKLATEQIKDFKLDLAVVTRTGENPADRGLLFGSPSLFQRLYYSELRGEFGNLGDRHTYISTSTENMLLTAPFSVIIPTPAYAVDGGVDELVAEGEELFFEETFDGNGRTCGTCHPMENNLTIDPEFIATLPDDDPLFVAEFNPDLSENFEKPELMRQFGLILENVDGFDDLEHKFVMRGVPHTLALTTSLLQPRIGADLPINEVGQAIKEGMDMTGWSGDGAPGGGTLREFATGAVTQHFTKTLARVAGVDFRLPNDDELDALEAFQLSLGRQEDPILTADNSSGLVLKNVKGGAVGLDVIEGKKVFINGSGLDQFFRPDSTKVGKCITCHFNAGATSGRHLQIPPLPEEGMNRNVATGAEFFPLPDGSDRHFTLNIPVDGGFGRVNRSVDVVSGRCDDGVTTTPSPTCCIAPSPTCGIGDGRFNSPPLIEAADTPPFFHNNAFNTIEEAVAFYNSALFNAGRGVNEIHLLPNQITQIAAFLRVLNALDNIRSSVEFLNRAYDLVGVNQDGVNKALTASIFDLNDARDVLNEKGLHPAAQGHLNAALSQVNNALKAKKDSIRENKIAQAVKKAVQAQNDMCIPATGSVLCEAEEL